MREILRAVAVHEGGEVQGHNSARKADTGAACAS